MNGASIQDWNTITSEEAYRLGQAEFRGMTIQALKDIKEDIAEIKQQNSVTRYISMAIAGISGIVSGILGKDVHI